MAESLSNTISTQVIAVACQGEVSRANEIVDESDIAIDLEQVFQSCLGCTCSFPSTPHSYLLPRTLTISTIATIARKPHLPSQTPPDEAKPYPRNLHHALNLPEVRQFHRRRGQDVFELWGGKSNIALHGKPSGCTPELTRPKTCPQ